MDVRNHGEKDPIDCAEKGDIEYFKNVSEDVILRARNPKGYTVLDRAVMEGSLECCEVICRRCPELVYHQNTTDLTTAVTHAAYKGDTDKILLLFYTAAELYTAAERVYDHGMPEDLLRKKDLRKATPLHWAVDQRKIDAAHCLMRLDRDGGLEYGPNQEGDTPLLLAIRNNDDRDSVEIRRLILDMLPTQCLIRSGEKNWTVLHLTASKGNIDVVKDIIHRRPNYADLRDTDNRNFLHLAAQFGRTELVKHVLENENIDPSVLNAIDNYGNTPFHIAALSGNRIMTEVFLYSPKVHKYTVNAKGQKVLDAVTFDYDKARAQVSGVRDRVDEKELKEQSDFDLVVGALIAAVSFTAGITVPGGYISDGPNRGKAVLSKETAFWTFVVSNTLGLVLSLYAAFSHFCVRYLLDKKEIDLQVHVAMCCTLCAMLAMVVAFISGSYAVLNISHRLAMTVIVICCTFFLFTFWALWRMARQYKQKLFMFLSPTKICFCPRRIRQLCPS